MAPTGDTPQEIVRIDGLAHDGRGVARRKGKAVFVAGALPGEDVTIRLLRERNSHDEAVLVSVIGASADRMAPPCPHARNCGGCNLQHLAPQAQLASQQQRLADTLKRIGNLAPKHWMAPVSSGPWHYRSRARLAVTRNRQDGTVELGFRREESTRIEPIEECPVLVPELSTLPARMRETLQSLQGPVLPQEIWLAAGDDGIALGFCSRSTLSTQDRSILRGLGEELEAQTGFGVLTSPHVRHWETPAPQLHYSPEPGVRLAFAPWDFTQANRAVNEALVERVIEVLAPTTDDAVLDLFCGIGNFSLPLARRARRVLGIEGSAAQVTAAEENARANGVDNAAFLAADLFRPESLQTMPRKTFSLAVIDPPRAGAALLCENLHTLGLRRIAYVSCDAATLARDARTLSAKGFRLLSAGVLQMFPHTSHAESLALFAR